MTSVIKKKIGKQGRWPQALGLFFLPLILFFSFRWLVLEPFVIPSESMVPSLFIHDHILVQKFSYGLKPLFGDGWIFLWSQPKRGDVVVFRYPENREVYFIKRLIGLPGDKIEVQGVNLKINGELTEYKTIDQPYQKISSRLKSQAAAEYYSEVITVGDIKSSPHFVRFENGQDANSGDQTITVPKDSFFMMGDNRFSSHDSRFWGFVPKDLIVGRAQYIWFSCDKMLESAPFICDPTSLRLERLFKTIN